MPAGCRLAVWGLANTLLARRVERGCAGGCACSDSAFGLSRLCNFVVSLMTCVGMFALAIACSARPESLLRRLQTGVSDADLQQLLLEWKLLTCPAAHGAVLDPEPAAELTAGSWELAEEEAAGLSCTSDNLGWSSAQDDALGWVATRQGVHNNRAYGPTLDGRSGARAVVPITAIAIMINMRKVDMVCPVLYLLPAKYGAYQPIIEGC